MRLARRVQALEESATLRVSQRAAELRRSGVEVVDFGAGEPDFDSPARAVEAAGRALAGGFTRYTPAAGTPGLRRALSERYRREHDAPWEARQAVITVGAKAALFELALALFEEGDEVVLPTPAWVSFPEQVRLAGAAAVEVPLDAGDGFSIRAEPLIAAMTPRTRAVIVNSPCNPTGGMVGADDLERLVAAAAERGILVISDETYEHFVYDGRANASAARLAAAHPDTVVLVGSFSKTYAMTGWRVGYALGPAEVIEGVIRVQGHATSNPTSFAMVGAEAVLGDDAGEVAAMRAEYQARRDLLVDRLDRIPGVSCRRPAGAFYAFPDVSGLFRDGLDGSVAIAERLLDEARVAVVPGAAFGADRHLRLSFACSREEIRRGADRIEEAVARLAEV